MTDSSLKLARRCGIELNGALRLLCSEKVTAKLKEKSRDNRIQHGDSYGIYFLDKQPSVYFVLFHNNLTRHCHSLRPTNGTEFECFNGVDRNATLVGLGETDYVTCLDHHSTYTDDLMQACGIHWRPRPAVTVMHYSARFLEETPGVATSSASSQFEWELLLIVLILSMLLCLLSKLRK